LAGGEVLDSLDHMQSVHAGLYAAMTRPDANLGFPMVGRMKKCAFLSALEINLRWFRSSRSG
jgi:hypothetical protein